MPQIDSNDIPFNESALRNKNIDPIIENLLREQTTSPSSGNIPTGIKYNPEVIIGIILLIVLVMMTVIVNGGVSIFKFGKKQSDVQNYSNVVIPQIKQWKYFESEDWKVYEGDVPPWSNRSSFTHTVMLESGQERVDLLEVLPDDYIEFNVKNENGVPISYMFKGYIGGIGRRIDANNFVMHINENSTKQMMYISRDMGYSGNVEITFTVYRIIPFSEETDLQEQMSLEKNESTSDTGDQMATTITKNIQQKPLQKSRISLSSYELNLGKVNMYRYGNRIYGCNNRVLVISNIGEGNLKINDVISPSLPFEIARNHCIKTLEPNESCDIVVRFCPYTKYQGAIGDYSYKDTFKDKLEVYTNEGVSRVDLVAQSEYM